MADTTARVAGLVLVAAEAAAVRAAAAAAVAASTAAGGTAEAALGAVASNVANLATLKKPIVRNSRFISRGVGQTALDRNTAYLVALSARRAAATRASRLGAVAGDVASLAAPVARLSLLRTFRAITA